MTAVVAASSTSWVVAAREATNCQDAAARGSVPKRASGANSTSQAGVEMGATSFLVVVSQTPAEVAPVEASSFQVEETSCQGLVPRNVVEVVQPEVTRCLAWEPKTGAGAVVRVETNYRMKVTSAEAVVVPERGTESQVATTARRPAAADLE